jgi:predicted ArsR family transcriptional regulator
VGVDLVPQDYWKAVRDLGEFTASDVAETLGITRQAASKMLWRLVERGVLEASARRGYRGRPATMYRLMEGL